MNCSNWKLKIPNKHSFFGHKGKHQFDVFKIVWYSGSRLLELVLDRDKLSQITDW